MIRKSRVPQRDRNLIAHIDNIGYGVLSISGQSEQEKRESRGGGSMSNGRKWHGTLFPALCGNPAPPRLRWCSIWFSPRSRRPEQKSRKWSAKKCRGSTQTSPAPCVYLGLPSYF